MRYLTLIRHAKSSWDDPNLEDFERPLNARGRRDAPAMATRAALLAGRPDAWLSSPARRAIQTARSFADTLGVASEQIELRPSLYHASLDQLRACIQQWPADWQQVWLFGHNPGLSDLARWLCDEAPAELPTCAVAQLALPPDPWSRLAPGSASLRCYLYPKQARVG
jgi:phosphohistidine phosphatase